MLQAGLAPDVFTHTAIIDILGRTGEVDDALR
jgi:PPR repeat